MAQRQQAICSLAICRPCHGVEGIRGSGDPPRHQRTIAWLSRRLHQGTRSPTSDTTQDDRQLMAPICDGFHPCRHVAGSSGGSYRHPQGSPRGGYPEGLPAGQRGTGQARPRFLAPAGHCFPTVLDRVGALGGVIISVSPRPSGSTIGTRHGCNFRCLQTSLARLA